MGNSTLKSKKDVLRPPPKYLFVDLISILEGATTDHKFSNNDLLCNKIDGSHSQVLKNGVKVLNHLNSLVDEFDYSIIFHSSHKEKQQLDTMEMLNHVCKEKGVKDFPRVLAMSVRDSSLYTNVDAAHAVIIKNRSHGISLACYGKKVDGKKCARMALRKLLNITESELKRCVIIENDSAAVNVARSEGCKVYDTKILSLLQIVEDLYQKECISRFGSNRHANKDLKNDLLLSKTKFKALEEHQIPLDRIFVNEEDKSECVEKWSEKAIGVSNLNKEDGYPDYYAEYKEYVCNRLYNYFGVIVPEVLLSEQVLTLESQNKVKKHRLRLMSKCVKNVKGFHSSFATEYKTKNSEGCFKIEGRPLEGLGRFLAVAYFLNEPNCIGESGRKIGYVQENEKNRVVKLDCKNALIFSTISSGFGGLEDSTKKLGFSAKEANITFDELNKADQREFEKTIKEIFDAPNEALSLVFEPIVSVDSRFIEIIDKLLERKCRHLATFPQESLKMLSHRLEEIPESSQEDKLSEEDKLFKNNEMSKINHSRVESKRYKIITDDSDHTTKFQILQPSKYFSGRTYELEQIVKFFEAGEPIISIVGTSGIGKSELTAQYVNQASYSTVIWLQAEQDILFTQIQIYMQARLDIEPGILDKTKMIDLFYRNLVLLKEGADNKICLVIDGATSQEEMMAYLPRKEHQKHFNILIISSSENWLSVPMIILQPLMIDETSEYIRKRLEFLDLAGLIGFNALLEGLLLSITQAVSFIEQHLITLEEYCELFGKHFDSQDLQLENSEIKIAFRVLELSLSKIIEKRPECNELLSIFAYISPNDISSSLLRSYYGHWEDFEDTLQLLTAYSIITRSSEETEFKMHPLTQTSLRLHYIKNHCYDSYAKRTYDFLFPKLNYKESSLREAQRVSLLIPHSAALCELKTSLEPTAIAEMFCKIALHQHYATGNYQAALKYYQRALEINGKFYGKDHIQTALILINLANAGGCLGDYDTKKDMLKIGADITEVHFGKDHPKTAIILINLANAWGSLGDYTSKRDLLIKALGIIEKKRGIDHLQTGITLANLGSALSKLKDYEKAYECQRRAYKIFHKLFGEENKHTRFSASKLKQIEEARIKKGINF